MVICLERGADLHMVQLIPLPLIVSCFSKIQIGFTFLVPAHLGSPGKKAVKRVCVLILTPYNGTEMAFYVLMCRKETAHSLTHALTHSRSIIILCVYVGRGTNYMLTGDVEYHVLVSGGRAGQVAAVDAGVALLGPADDEHRQGAVVRPVDPVPAVGDDETLAGRDGPRVDRYAVHVGGGRGGPRHATGRGVGAAAAVAVPVDLHTGRTSQHRHRPSHSNNPYI